MISTSYSSAILKAPPLSIGVLGGDGQTEALVNVNHRTLSGWSRTTLVLLLHADVGHHILRVEVVDLGL